MDERFDDIDERLRAAASARPTAELEEELLLRLRDELDAARRLNEAGEVDLELTPAAAPDERRRATTRRPQLLLAAAAAIVVAATFAVLSASDDPTTDTGPAAEAEADDASVASAAVIDEACRTHLPALTDFDSIDAPAGFDAVEARRTFVAPVVDAMDAMIASLATSSRPEIDTVRRQLEAIAEQMARQTDRLGGRNEGDVIAIIATLTDRALLAIDELANFDSPACRVATG